MHLADAFNQSDLQYIRGGGGGGERSVIYLKNKRY